MVINGDVPQGRKKGTGPFFKEVGQSLFYLSMDRKGQSKKRGLSPFSTFSRGNVPFIDKEGLLWYICSQNT